MWRSSERPDSYAWRRGRGGQCRSRVGWSAGAPVRGGWSGQRPSASPEPPLGPLVSSVSKHDFDQRAKDYKPESFITDCRTVASYNWLDRAEPTIVIPGKPPKWTPLAAPRQLSPDNGQYFRDMNSANFPKHPIEPAIVAAVTMQPSVSRTVDIVACGSTIGNLLRFLQGEDKPFRMLVELIGETVFFIRRENSPRELIPDVQGYGHSFPEAYTTWEPEVKGSTSHQRVISYRFGGLSFLLRFEGDGYVVNEENNEESVEGSTRSRSSGMSDFDAAAELDLLSDQLTGNQVTSKMPEKGNDELKVLRAGKLVRQDHVFDLKTRSIWKKASEPLEATLSNEMKRLWVAQIPNFILAYHTYGTFEEIHVKTAQDQVEDWERTHADLLSCLAALIHHIIGLVRDRPDHRAELRHDAVGVLEIREQLADAGDALSDSVKQLWEDGTVHTSRESSPDNTGFEDDTGFEGSSDCAWDVDSEPDYTACSADHCGYCGRCSY